MLFYRTEITSSEIAGKGLFALEDVPAGAVFGILSKDAGIMTEDEYDAEQARGNTLISQTAVRWVGELFLYCRSLSNEDYINHSETPNTLYHAGILFATRTISAGEEITADYRYFLSGRDKLGFKDSSTGTLVTGYDAREALEKSARELLALLERHRLITPRYSEFNPAAARRTGP